MIPEIPKIPEYRSEKFQCPHCDTVATQAWFTANNASNAAWNIIQDLYLDYRTKVAAYEQSCLKQFLDDIDTQFKSNFYRCIPKDFAVATCSSCNKFTLWVGQDIVHPKKTTLSPPNPDLNEDIEDLYREASSILGDSPKGSAALLRLALQKLLKQVGKSGENINNDIKELVNDGMNPKVQKALDILRVIGNNAVHPGQIDLDNDNAEIARKLFDILNFIADELITKPKGLERLYDNIIPAETQDHIQQRDKP